MIKIDVLIKDKNWKKYLSDPTRYLNKQAKKINLKEHFKYRLLNISIMLTGNNDIRTLNKKFRKKNKSTDILSFPNYDSKEIKKKLRLKKIFILVILCLIYTKLIGKKMILKKILINYGYMALYTCWDISITKIKIFLK